MIYPRSPEYHELMDQGPLPRTRKIVAYTILYLLGAFCLAAGVSSIAKHEPVAVARLEVGK